MLDSSKLIGHLQIRHCMRCAETVMDGQVDDAPLVCPDLIRSQISKLALGRKDGHKWKWNDSMTW